MAYKKQKKDSFEDFEEDMFPEEENEPSQSKDSYSEDGVFDEDLPLEQGNLDEETDYLDDLDEGMGEIGGTAPIEKHADLLKDLTNFDPFIKDKVNGWLGLTWSENESKYIRNTLAEPIMNAKCASWCIDFLKIYARGNNIITNISKDEYNNLVSDIIDVSWYNLATRADTDFNISNNGDILKVAVELQHTAELVLMGAGGGKYNEFLGTITSRHETGNIGMPQMPQMGNQQKSPGRWQRIKGMLVGN